MSGQSLKTWSKKWDNLAGSDFDKAMQLLFEYSGSCKTKDGFSWVWGGSSGRFFSGRWDTHHGDAVEKTLAYFHNVSSPGAINEGLQTIGDLFEILNRNLQETGKKMSVEGDLYRILTIILFKTESCPKLLSVDSDSNHKGNSPLYLR